jgi:hypothetical protein
MPESLPDQNETRWFKVPKIVAIRHSAAKVREQAIAEGATVLDFSECEYISYSAADELVCKHNWEATTGEDEHAREAVVAALKRRGLLP